MKMTIFVEKEAESRSLGDVVCWNIQDSRRDEWPLLGAFNQRSKSPVPPGERLMGTGYFIRPSTSLARIWGCNCVCFGCCFVLQADKGEPAGWSGLGRGSQGAIRSGRSRSRRGKQVMKAWRFRTSGMPRGLNWMRNILFHDASFFDFEFKCGFCTLTCSLWQSARCMMIDTQTFHLDTIHFSSVTRWDCSDCYQQPVRPSDCPATPHLFHCNTTCQKHLLSNEFLRNYWWTLIIDSFIK